METETKSPLASEQSHWYQRETGNPVYEVPMTSKAGMRSTHIGDAKKLDLVPSWTTVYYNSVKSPGLDAYFENQLLDSALTLPIIQGESADARKKRIKLDAREHARKAREKGTQLHKAIEEAIKYRGFTYNQQGDPGATTGPWTQHIINTFQTLKQHGIDLYEGNPEHSFAASIDGNWYGGKMDFHTQQGERVLIDFKSKDKIEPKKQLVWDEHAMQIAAYGYGLFRRISSSKPWAWEAFRGLNVFVGVTDCEVRVIEHPQEDLVRGFEMFRDVLSFWCKKNRFGKYDTTRTIR